MDLRLWYLSEKRSGVEASLIQPVFGTGFKTLRCSQTEPAPGAAVQAGKVWISMTQNRVRPGKSSDKCSGNLEEAGDHFWWQEAEQALWKGGLTLIHALFLKYFEGRGTRKLGKGNKNE